MSQNILLIDYEPRTISRVTEALSPLGYRVDVVKDIDAAVGACAKVEPKLVIITSVLPRLKIEDAITQLRARAGLRHTPFLVLMSGYSGSDRHADAAALGAQAIVAKPFSADELLAEVRALLEAPRAPAPVSTDTRNEVLEALRRSAGLQPGGGTVTSEDLFGDLIADEAEAAPTPADTQRIQIRPEPPAVKPAPPPPPAPAPAAKPAQPQPSMDVAVTQPLKVTPPPPRPPKPDTAVERVLESTLGDVLAKPEQPAGRETARPSDTAVDRLLEQTLSGLDISRLKAKPRPEAPPPQAAAATREPPPPPRGAARMAPLPGGTPFGQYELIEPIATGGMAEVYKARMQGVEGFQKIVAIKRILPHLTDNDEFVTMFIDEAKLAAQLQHPNIIHIYDLGKIERSYYIAMEYIDGKDLRSILRMLEESGQRMPLGLALFIGSHLAAALDYAHRKKDLQGRAMALVHRDVSPQNVLISFDGDIKLCDFGIAKAASKASHTRAGALKGKLQYMSPEQAWGKGIDHRSDIFSLGLVLYEMVTGTKAFAGDSELSILEQVRSPRLTPPHVVDPAVPAEVSDVIMKALKEDRDERFQTAAELAAALDGLLQGIRPAPTASELGRFLARLTGREKPAEGAAAAVAAPTPQPPPPVAAAPPVADVKPTAPAAPQAPAPAVAPPKPAVVLPPPMESGVTPPPPRKLPVGLVAGGAVAVLAVVLGVMLLPRLKGGGGGAVPTPPPETVELARQLTQEALAQQGLTPAEPATEQPAPTQPAPLEPVAPPTRPTPAAAGATPRPEPTRAGVPTPPPVETPAPAVVATVAPTAPPAVASPAPTAAPAIPTPTPQPSPPPVATRVPAVAEEPQVREGDFVPVSTAGLIPPEPIVSPRPNYPPLAARQRVGGTVIIQALVDETGAVRETTVLRGVKPDLGLDAAAVSAVQKWRFKPATLNGVKVRTYYTAVIPFRP